MRKREVRKSRQKADARAEDERERLLLLEFQSHETVEALARAIATRLRGRTKARDFLATAGLVQTSAPDGSLRPATRAGRINRAAGKSR